MFSLPLGICCKRSDSLSSVSLQSLSTRHGFLGFFSKVHSPQSSMTVHFWTCGTFTCAVQLLLRVSGFPPGRLVVAVPVTVMVLPASALVAVKVDVVPLPLNCPPVADQLYVIGHPCGSVAVIVMVDGSPMAMVVGLAEQLTFGGKGCLIVKFAAHIAGFMGSGLPKTECVPES